MLKNDIDLEKKNPFKDRQETVKIFFTCVHMYAHVFNCYSNAFLFNKMLSNQ